MSQPAAAAVDLYPLLSTVLLVVGALVIAVLSGVVGRPMAAGPVHRRRERLIAGSRPALLQLLVDDEPHPEAVRRLSMVRSAQWRAIEPILIGLLGKVRGAAREHLVLVLAGTPRR